MISTAVLLALLLIATVTDVRWRRIYNGTTYSGMLIALCANALAALFSTGRAAPSDGWLWWTGTVGLEQSALGLLACGGVMVVCYVFFPGGVGGGDIKLIAMIGAFLGLYAGIETMLWTFVLAGCVGLISLVWRFGLIRILRRTVKYLLLWLRLGAMFPLTEEERKPLKTKLFLAPSALVAVLMVRFQLVGWF